MNPKDLTQGMVAGAVVGYRLGADLRDRLQANTYNTEVDDVIREWKVHSERLAKELRLTKNSLEATRGSVAIRDEAIDELGDLAKKLEIEAQRFSRLLEQRESELLKLREENRNLEDSNENLRRKLRLLDIEQNCSSQEIRVLKQDNAKLNESNQINGAQAAAYAELFYLLGDEVARSGNPDYSENLTPSSIRRIYQQAYLRFRQSGKVVYEPQHDYASLIDRKIKQQDSA